MASEAAMHAPPAAPGASPSDDGLDQAAADFAARAGALADLLQRWRRPALARTVLASLLADDGDTFRELLRDFDPPLAAKCWWLRGVIGSIADDVEYHTVCRLRTDLTAGERRLYLQLALQHVRRGTPPRLATGGDSLIDRGPAIAPGAFLEALRAEGLVICREEPACTAGLRQVLGRPHIVCV